MRRWSTGPIASTACGDRHFYFVAASKELGGGSGADSLLRPLLNATGDADSVTCIPKANFGEQDDEITAPVSDGNFNDGRAHCGFLCT
jgi:hypothetical protein